MTSIIYSRTEQEMMLKTALDTIAYGLTYYKFMSIDLKDYPHNLQKKGACFVTLQLKHTLRGCIGSLNAHQPLIYDLVHNAYAAAFNDPRFLPMTQQELPLLEVHISILSEPEPLSFVSKQDLIQKLHPNIDGLILSDKGQRGTFLPSVWEVLPQPQDFLEHLLMKAGFSKTYWSDTLEIERYTTTLVK